MQDLLFHTDAQPVLAGLESAMRGAEQSSIARWKRLKRHYANCFDSARKSGRPKAELRNYVRSAKFARDHAAWWEKKARQAA